MEPREAAPGLGQAAATRGAGSTTVRILEVPSVGVLLTLSHNPHVEGTLGHMLQVEGTLSHILQVEGSACQDAPAVSACPAGLPVDCWQEVLGWGFLGGRPLGTQKLLRAMHHQQQCQLALVDCQWVPAKGSVPGSAASRTQLLLLGGVCSSGLTWSRCAPGL